MRSGLHQKLFPGDNYQVDNGIQRGDSPGIGNAGICGGLPWPLALVHNAGQLSAITGIPLKLPNSQTLLIGFMQLELPWQYLLPVH